MDQHLKSGMVGCSNLSHMLVTASEFGHRFLLLVAREMPSPLFLGHGRQEREIERDRERERESSSKLLFPDLSGVTKGMLLVFSVFVLLFVF